MFLREQPDQVAGRARIPEYFKAKPLVLKEFLRWDLLRSPVGRETGRLIMATTLAYKFPRPNVRCIGLGEGIQSRVSLRSYG